MSKLARHLWLFAILGPFALTLASGVGPVAGRQAPLDVASLEPLAVTSHATVAVASPAAIALGPRVTLALGPPSPIAVGPPATPFGDRQLVGEDRTVAIGDVHGDYDELVRILRFAGLVNEDLEWSGGSTRLILTGDLIDRGSRSRDVLDLLMRLQPQAPGQVHVLTGNHEVMNLMGDLRYVPESEYESYATPGSEALRKSRYDGYREFLGSRARRLGFEEQALEGEARERWMAAHPRGFFEHREAFRPGGRYGRWLRGLNAVLLSGGTLFVHGGLDEERLFPSVEALNERVHREISTFDSLWSSLSRGGVIWDDLTWSEAAQLLREELVVWEAIDSLPPERVDPAAAEHRPAAATLQGMRDLLAQRSWTSAAPDGPLWHRGLAVEPEDALESELERVLSHYGADRIVVGHTPTEDSRIHVRLDGRVFVVDSGISAAVGGRPSALEIRNGRFAALYPDEEPVVLWEAGWETGSSKAQGQPRQQEPSQERAYDALQGLSPEKIESFLRASPIVEVRKLSIGITKPSRVTLDDGGLRHDAAVQGVNSCEDVVKPGQRRKERVCDSYKYNIAAYELAKLLGITSIPASVERKFDDKPGAFTWWLEDVMSFADMREQKLSPPDGVTWNRQQRIIGVFDELIYNTDRHQNNLLVDPTWRIWMIDHSRAFRTDRQLKNPAMLAKLRIEPWLFSALESLTQEALGRCCGAYLTSEEMKAVLARRDALVEHFRPQIETEAEAAAAAR